MLMCERYTPLTPPEGHSGKLAYTFVICTQCFGPVFTESRSESMYFAESESGSSLLLITDLIRIQIQTNIYY
jgi:hypothetical protein